MLRILQSLLVVSSLLALAFVAAEANSAPLTDPDGQSPSIGPATGSDGTAIHCRPRPFAAALHHRLVPGPQAGTHLQAQPFAYGYFGARPNDGCLPYQQPRRLVSVDVYTSRLTYSTLLRRRWLRVKRRSVYFSSM